MASDEPKPLSLAGTAPLSGPVQVPISGLVQVPLSGPVQVPLSGPVQVPLSGPARHALAEAVLLSSNKAKTSDEKQVIIFVEKLKFRSTEQ